eukprot:CAMPEP_0172813532 /NCGR_PEP_ID=MMETSP1075-20121228/10716_1 /TAXON_ID=2916 /ORGANISM="Ceratium fusus, Strain PA161109" /LENGTH=505 /DNA_ID=CAMNT_0013653245 /DNA_START=30 /DNA_END=1545 /DNA_ORIENTATION=+
MGPRMDDDQSVRKHLKVFAGGLPSNTTEHSVGAHFTRYGHVQSVSVVPPKENEAKKSQYAFVTFKFAADADCAVVDTQHFPGASRQLAMGFATPRRKDAEEAQNKAGLLSETDPCKVFIGGIGERDNEDAIGDFFSQWGLVALVYRDKGAWGFVHYATREGALRLLGEGSVIFQRRRLEIKASDSKRMDAAERNDLIRRAVARHFHKKSMGMGPPPQPSPPMGGCGPPAPGAYPPPAGYYAPPSPAGFYGGPQPGYPQSGYPPSGSYPPPGYPPAGYPPPGYPSSGAPPSGGYYGGGAPPGGSGYYGGPPVPGPSSGYPPGSSGGPPSGPPEGQRALPAPPSDYYHAGGGSGGSGPPAPASAPAGVDPYANSSAPPAGGYYSRGGPYTNSSTRTKAVLALKRPLAVVVALHLSVVRHEAALPRRLVHIRATTKAAKAVRAAAINAAAATTTIDPLVIHVAQLLRSHAATPLDTHRMQQHRLGQAEALAGVVVANQLTHQAQTLIT